MFAFDRLRVKSLVFMRVPAISLQTDYPKPCKTGVTVACKSTQYCKHTSQGHAKLRFVERHYCRVTDPTNLTAEPPVLWATLADTQSSL